MLTFIVAFQVALGSTAADSASSSPEANLIGTFKSACYNGSVRLRAGESAPLAATAVPAALRKWYKDTKWVTFYKLVAAPDSYLILFQGDGIGVNYKSGCALATTYTARKRLWTSITGKTPPTSRALRRLWNASVREEWPRPELGYTLTAHTVGLKYAVAQVSMLNESEIKRLLAEQEQNKRHFERGAAGIVKPVKVSP